MVFSCLFFCCCWLTAQFYCMQKSCTNIPFNISFCALQEQKIIQVCNKKMVFFFKKQKLFLSPHLPKNTRWRNMKLSIYLFVHVIYVVFGKSQLGFPPSHPHICNLLYCNTYASKRKLHDLYSGLLQYVPTGLAVNTL